MGVSKRSQKRQKKLNKRPAIMSWSFLPHRPVGEDGTPVDLTADVNVEWHPVERGSMTLSETLDYIETVKGGWRLPTGPEALSKIQADNWQTSYFWVADNIVLGDVSIGYGTGRSAMFLSAEDGLVGKANVLLVRERAD